ncbi:hypothetical protein VA596_22855 [Amycolatopsis sp., V23-08]|uniref:SMI1/KNR4 family protein n=1 Tax=Amycolatopsis heterodermiae TaxID=3110235 RepID=A0ABU5R845_9PSEU|nr:hypothetical protein [Amycolatopsis sp., V23-08]MEA5362396.1 hypothetical protein [Amycolatopsis sp., V23-08]
MKRVDELAALVGWTGTASAELSWQHVAEHLGLQFPAAYRELLEVFPAGELVDGIRVISPVQVTSPPPGTSPLQHDALYSDWEEAPKTFHPTRFMSA